MQTRGPFDVRASYADMDAARRGLEVLENSGIDAADISLSGPAAAEADTARSTVDKDVAVMDKGFKVSVAGAVVGTIVGAVVGIVLGAITFGSLASAGALTMAVGFAVAGGGVGLIVNALRTMRQGEAWETTLEEHGSGTHVVSAHVQSEDAVRTARDALAGTSPTEISCVDRDGKPLTPAS